MAGANRLSVPQAVRPPTFAQSLADRSVGRPAPTKGPHGRSARARVCTVGTLMRPSWRWRQVGGMLKAVVEFRIRRGLNGGFARRLTLGTPPGLEWLRPVSRRWQASIRDKRRGRWFINMPCLYASNVQTQIDSRTVGEGKSRLQVYLYLSVIR